MQIVLPPELEALVQRQITSGRYQTVLDVLVAGVQLLGHQDEQLAGGDITYGTLDGDRQFLPLTEAEMAQQSLAVLATYQQEDIYQGRLQDLQQDAAIGWQAAQRGDVVDGPTAMETLRADLRAKHPQ
jgi:antitoxin ParD1/3/4